MSHPIRFGALLLFACSAPAFADWHIPAKGCAERTEIIEVLRAKMTTYEPSNRDLVYVVRELCVSDKSGWIEVDPRSPDGQSQFEPIEATLTHKPTGWTVGQIACGEEECAKGTDAAALRKKVAPRCR